jgi:hypothetical protein
MGEESGELTSDARDSVGDDGNSLVSVGDPDSIANQLSQTILLER